MSPSSDPGQLQAVSHARMQCLAPAEAKEGRFLPSPLQESSSCRVALHSCTDTTKPQRGIMAARVRDLAAEAASMPVDQLQIVTDAAAMRRFSRQHRAAGRTLALVPTMVGPNDAV